MILVNVYIHYCFCLWLVSMHVLKHVGSREGDELLQGREWVAEGAVAGGRGVVGKEEGGVRVWEGGAKSLRVD